MTNRPDDANKPEEKRSTPVYDDFIYDDFSDRAHHAPRFRFPDPAKEQAAENDVEAESS